MKVYMPWPKRANNSWVYGGFARSDERNKRKGSEAIRKGKMRENHHCHYPQKENWRAAPKGLTHLGARAPTTQSSQQTLDLASG